LLVAEMFGNLLADRSSRPHTGGVESPASIFSIAILPGSRRAEQLIGRDRQFARPAAARTRGRLTGTATTQVTEPRSRPWRTAVRVASCCFVPANAVTSASINAPSPADRHNGKAAILLHVLGDLGHRTLTAPVTRSATG